MKEMTMAGIREKPMETTNAMKNPLAEAARYFSFSVTGNGLVVNFSVRFGLPRDYLRMDS
jgi:hypothetical protein